MAVQRDKVIASAEKLVAKGKIEPAIKEYERLLDDNPNDVNTLNRIGDLWVRINRTDEAVKVFVKIADHYSKDGFFLKAIAIYKKINKLDPSRLEIYSRLADLYAKQGLAMEAKSQYQVLADYYMKHGEPANALGIYKKISELDPQAINVHVKLADLYSQNNQTAEALKEYDRVGRMLLKRGMLDEAVQVFRKALKVDPRNTELVDSLVTALVEAKDFDSARQIVDVALEANKNDARLLALLGRIQLGRGDASAAQATLERAIAANPDETSVRDTLAEIYLRQSDSSRALEMIAPLAEKALARGERSVALDLLNRIIRVQPGHTPTLERLVAMYTRLNEESNVVAAMSSLAEAHVAHGEFEQGAHVLEKLIDREPQNSQHRTKLQFVRAQMGDNDTLPPGARAESAPTLPAMEIEEPAPTFDAEPSIEIEHDSSFTLDLAAAEPLELDLSALPPEPPSETPPLPALKPAIDQVPSDLEGDEDLDFITEHLTEAEVFAKYGLAEKAIEHLRAVLERSPRNVTANERLFRIYLEEGDAQSARAAAQAYVGVLSEKGDAAGIDAITNEFHVRGHAFEPIVAPAAAGPRGAAAPREPEIEIEPEIEVEPEITLDDFAPAGETSLDLETDVPEIEFELEQPETESELPPLEHAPAFDVPAEPQIEFEVPAGEALEFEPVEPQIAASDEMATEFASGEQPELALPVVEATDALFTPAPAAAEWETVDEPLGFSEAEADVPEALELEELAEVTPAAARLESAPQEPAPEELAEIDFYVEQELFDEARRKLESLSARFAGHPELESRKSLLTVTPPALSRDEIETELLSAIPDDEEEVAAAPQSAPATVAPAVHAAAVHEENLFADEDNFFDLAAELESELADEEEAISLSEEEQSLEEIFKEFKKGVEQQLDSEDYDTHYNLGIAYKEMGLIDEAIGEFQLASKDPKRAVECASMLGLCFLEKGMPQLAIKWYRKGLEMPEISQDEHIGLLYDLASAHQEVGDTEAAQKAFLEVYGMNSNYRDIVSRIKQLEDAQR